MSLKIRRGTDTERLTITPAEGELIYTTDTKELYVGDGSTVGGNVVTGYTGSISGGDRGPTGYRGSVGDKGDPGDNGYRGSVGYTGSVGDTGYRGSVGYNGSVGDTGYKGSAGAVGYTGSTPTGGTLTEDLDLNSYDLTGTGNINVTGNISNGTITIDSTGTLISNLLPVVDSGNSPIFVGSSSSPITLTSYSDRVQHTYYSTVVGNQGNPYIEHRISRGTLEVPQALDKFDMGGLHKVFGYDGNDYIPFCTYGGIIDPHNDVTVGSISGGFVVTVVADGGASPDQTLTFSSAGELRVPILCLVASTEPDLRVKQEGWMYFDTDTKQFKGWNGSNWVILG